MPSSAINTTRIAASALDIPHFSKILVSGKSNMEMSTEKYNGTNTVLLAVRQLLIVSSFADHFIQSIRICVK